MLRRLKCLFRHHQWHSEYDRAWKKTTWTCARCGGERVDWDASADTRGIGGEMGGYG
jgi:hypothetical protein